MWGGAADAETPQLGSCGCSASIRDGEVEVMQMVVDAVGKQQAVTAAAVLAGRCGARREGSKVFRVPNLLDGVAVVEGLRWLQQSKE